MRSMQQQLGNLGTISAFACRQRETKNTLCRGGRWQDLPDTDFQPAVRHDSFIAYKAWIHRNIPYICCLTQGDDTTGLLYCIHGRESQSTILGWSAGTGYSCEGQCKSFICLENYKDEQNYDIFSFCWCIKLGVWTEHAITFLHITVF